MTLLEVVIAAAILAVVFAVAYALVASAGSLSHSELSLRDRQFRLHEFEDRLAAELRESSPPLIRATGFTDGSMPSANQTVLVFASARDGSNLFRVQNAAPQWQRVVLYAARWDATLKTGELRRYVLSPAPAAFTDPAQTPSVTVDATTITAGGSSIPRTGGERVLLGMDYFRATIGGTTVSLDVALQGSSIAKQTSINLQTGATGRN